MAANTETALEYIAPMFNTPVEIDCIEDETDAKFAVYVTTGFLKYPPTFELAMSVFCQSFSNFGIVFIVLIVLSE